MAHMARIGIGIGCNVAHIGQLQARTWRLGLPREHTPSAPVMQLPSWAGGCRQAGGGSQGEAADGAPEGPARV